MSEPFLQPVSQSQEVFPRTAPTLHELHWARQIILGRTGIVIQDYQQASLIETLNSTQEAFAIPSCTALLNQLQNCSPNAPEMEFLVTRITIGESYFFRDEEQIDFLRTVWLPKTIAAKRHEGSLTLRIWTAGCSSGQETVTLAILLQEAIPDLSQWHIHLLGTDINVTALQQAIAGIYSEWSFRTTPTWYKDRYFQPVDKEWRIRENLRAMMKFTYLNLIEDAYPTSLGQTHSMDLILCRNVFIYFDAPTIAHSTTRLAECLLPGGYLVLGVADMIQNKILGCIPHTHGRYLYYQREDPTHPFKQPKIQPEVQFSPSLAPLITKANIQPKPPIRPDQAEEKIRAMMGKEAWTMALEAINKIPKNQQKTAKLLQYKAKILANLGQTESTITLCQSSLALESTDKHVYLILGLALLESNHITEAESAFRKALFLDRKFLECHFQLGLLLLQTNRATLGVKSLQNALDLAEKSPPHWLIHNASNTSIDHFAHILRAEISLYAKRLP